MMESFRIHLGGLDQIPLGKSRLFTIGYHEVAVFRSQEGHLFAFENRCPKGSPLVGGLVNKNQVECPTHEHKFDLYSGQGIDIPEAVKKFKVWEENKNIVLAFVFPEARMANIEQ